MSTSKSLFLQHFRNSDLPRMSAKREKEWKVKLCSLVCFSILCAGSWSFSVEFTSYIWLLFAVFFSSLIRVVAHLKWKSEFFWLLSTSSSSSSFFLICFFSSCSCCCWFRCHLRFIMVLNRFNGYTITHDKSIWTPNKSPY